MVSNLVTSNDASNDSKRFVQRYAREIRQPAQVYTNVRTYVHRSQTAGKHVPSKYVKGDTFRYRNWFHFPLAVWTTRSDDIIRCSYLLIEDPYLWPIEKNSTRDWILDRMHRHVESAPLNAANPITQVTAPIRGYRCIHTLKINN